MWPNPQETTDLTTFTEEILNEKRHFLYCNKQILKQLSFHVKIFHRNSGGGGMYELNGKKDLFESSAQQKST